VSPSDLPVRRHTMAASWHRRADSNESCSMQAPSYLPPSMLVQNIGPNSSPVSSSTCRTPTHLVSTHTSARRDVTTQDRPTKM